MKTTIEYSTKCCVTICETNDYTWLFENNFRNLQDAIDWAEFQIDVNPHNFEIKVVYISDSETGELLATCKPDKVSGPTAVDWENPNYNPDDWDDDEEESEDTEWTWL